MLTRIYFIEPPVCFLKVVWLGTDTGTAQHRPVYAVNVVDLEDGFAPVAAFGAGFQQKVQSGNKEPDTDELYTVLRKV